MELAKNKKAYFDYEILNDYEAGMVLKGHEVKAIRKKMVNLKGGYVSIRNNEVWLESIHISPYQIKNQPEENGSRKVKLLLQKREIAKIEHQSSEPGVTIIPLKIFLKGNKLKLKIGICRGKKKFDKRSTIKNRESDREIQRRFKSH
jgi:SsrA-binding protein